MNLWRLVGCGLCLWLGGLLHGADFSRSSGKHVQVDKTNQLLRAYEGDELVMEAPVSTGKQGKATPNGQFRVGTKLLMHRSRLYHNAPMPYSVQIKGNYFIHGFKSVPNQPASHGCIRLPVEQAKDFFEWVTPGTPVEVTGQWPGYQTSKAKAVREEAR